MPISLTVHGRLVYVLNAGGAGNIAGFRVGRHGLTPIAGSVRPLGAGSAGPAEVAFTPDGSALVVTEKASSTIDTYPVDASGVAGAPTVSSLCRDDAVRLRLRPPRPPARLRGRRHRLVLRRRRRGGVSVISGALATGQAAPCWLVARTAGFAYTANARLRHHLRLLRIGRDGVLTLLDASGVTADLGAGSHPLDETVTRHGGGSSTT